MINGEELKGKTVKVKPMEHFYQKKIGGDYFSLTYKNRIEEYFSGREAKVLSYNRQDNEYTVMNKMNVVIELDIEDFDLE